MTWERRKLTPSFGMELGGQSLKPGLPLSEMKAVYDAVLEPAILLVGNDLVDRHGELRITRPSSLGTVRAGT